MGKTGKCADNNITHVHNIIQRVRYYCQAQIGFSNYCQEFEKSRVDGDLLLQLDERMLQDDIGIKNGILRRRFMRELAMLKQITDYSSCDSTNLCGVLSILGPDYTKYTYSMLQSGVDRGTMSSVTEETLLHECNVHNSIHRMRILQALQSMFLCDFSARIAKNL